MTMQEGNTARGRRHLIIVFLLIVIPLLLASVQSKYSLFVFRDGFATHYPIKKLFIEQIKNKVIPFWNPSASFGQPLLGNPNDLPFYPDNVLFLALPFDVAWNFHYWFHWIFGAVGVYQLLRCLKRTAQISLFGSIWWAASGFVLSLFSFYNLIAAVSWIPWIILSFRLLITNGKIANSIALGTCI